MGHTDVVALDSHRAQQRKFVENNLQMVYGDAYSVLGCVRAAQTVTEKFFIEALLSVGDITEPERSDHARKLSNANAVILTLNHVKP